MIYIYIQINLENLEDYLFLYTTVISLQDSVIYNAKNRKKLFSLSKKIKGVELAKEFLTKFNTELKDVSDYEDQDSCFIYYNIVSQDFESYDTQGFNQKFEQFYLKEYYFKNIDNEFFNLLQSCINQCKRPKNLTKYQESRLTPMFLFFLRKSQVAHHAFSYNQVIKEFNIWLRYCKSGITLAEQKEFIDLLVEILEKKYIIGRYTEDYGLLRFESRYIRSLAKTIHRSYDYIAFGRKKSTIKWFDNFYSVVVSSIEKLAKNYDKISPGRRHYLDDLIFHYIICSTVEIFGFNSDLVLVNRFYELLKDLPQPSKVLDGIFLYDHTVGKLE